MTIIGPMGDPAKSQLDVSLGHIETRGSVGEGKVISV